MAGLDRRASELRRGNHPWRWWACREQKSYWSRCLGINVHGVMHLQQNQGRIQLFFISHLLQLARLELRLLVQSDIATDNELGPLAIFVL